jgi:hypothetical protein
MLIVIYLRMIKAMKKPLRNLNRKKPMKYFVLQRNNNKNLSSLIYRKHTTLHISSRQPWKRNKMKRDDRNS